MKLGKDTTINVDKLIESKLLIQANSGGGKSWLIRRILEQTHGKVQQIVLDPEGEFSSLREKFDYILAGKEGDTPADPKSAALLAYKLLELNVSAIIDLYELHPQERKRFVRLFLDAMVNSPKKLWHPCLVVIDEAHTFVPEKGESEASNSVIGLASLGRKRGFCAVLATQRIAKLHKDAAAECNNKLIGRTGLDIDRKRASEELGFTNKEEVLSLRTLKPGEFYAFGPAISDEVKKVTVGDVYTSHPKAGSKINTKVAPPTDKIKGILGKLADLPEEARKEAQTTKELKDEIRLLKMHRCPKITSVDDIDKAVKIALQRQQKEFEQQQVKFVNVISQISKIISPISESKIEIPKIKVQLPVVSQSIHKPVRQEVFKGDVNITGGALRMLKVLVSRYPMVLTKSQLATFSKLSPRSGTYGTYLSVLRSNSLIEESGDGLVASQSGIDYLGESPEPPQTTEEIIKMWKSNLNGGARRMFEVLVDQYPSELSKEMLGEMTGLSASSGTFGTYLSLLRSNSLVEVSSSGIKASDNIFV